MKTITSLLALCILGAPVHAKSININLYNNAGSAENNQVSINDYYLSPGTPVTLNWKTSGATDISIAPSVGDVTSLSSDGNGSTSVTPASTTIYTLSASNTGGTTSATLRIGIGQAKHSLFPCR